MQTVLRLVLALAGLVIATQATAQITFYEHEDFQGRYFTTESPVADFQRHGFRVALPRQSRSTWDAGRSAAATAAAALVGGLLLVVALVLLLVANRGIRRACRAEAVGAGGSRQRPGDAERSSPSELAASLGAVVGDETVKWTRAHPFSALAAALVAGIAVGVSPRLRSELEQLMGALSGKGASGIRDP